MSLPRLPLSVGIDFGTTNSALATADGDGTVQLARFGPGGSFGDTFRSVLYFPARQSYSKTLPVPETGHAAIDAYLARESGGRLVQSIKSLASDRLFRHTEIGGHLFTFEDLVFWIVRGLIESAGKRRESMPQRIVVGRPVRFVGAKTEADEAFAVERIRRAFEQAGFAEIAFEYEPVGAAYFYETQLDHDELVLIADFGGGTSDFSLIEVGPGVRRRGRTARNIIGGAGVPLAGDSFDAAIIRHLVSPILGRGSHYRSLGKDLPVPHSLYRRLERWHHLSFLQSRETMRTLRSIEAQADHSEMLRALIHLVEEDLGFQLHRAVQRTKGELSVAEVSRFRFVESGLVIERDVRRADFEAWIGDDLDRIAAAVDELLKQSGVGPKAVDHVFLTGGSSLVPAVRKIFEGRFGADRMDGGGEFTSVAAGLALRARELDCDSSI